MRAYGVSKTTSLNIDRTSGVFLLVLASLWGGSFFFAEIALSQVSPITIALHRVFWAAIILFFIIKVKDIKLPNLTRTWFIYLMMGALNNAIPFSLIFWGQAHVGSGLASILNGTTAIFGVVISGIFLTDEALTKRKFIGVSFGFFGVIMIMGFDSIQNFNPSNLAQLSILGGALSYAFAGVWGRRFLSDYSPISNAFGMLLGATILLIPTVLIFEGGPSFAISTDVFLSLISLGVFSTAFAYLLYFSILKRAGSANLMLVTLLIPPIAIAMSYFGLNKSYNGEGLYGFVLIALGLLIIDGRLKLFLVKILSK